LNFIKISQSILGNVGGEDDDFRNVAMRVVEVIDPSFAAKGALEVITREINEPSCRPFVGDVGRYTIYLELGMRRMEAVPRSAGR
jgi:hypothetical protein